MDQPDIHDPAAALQAALAASQAADDGHPDLPSDNPPPPLAVPDLPSVEASDDATVRFDAHGFPHRGSQPIAWGDIR